MVNDESLSVPLARFLAVEVCPPAWRAYDLYLFRDETVVFYAGQSACAFERVWEHVRGGPRGHSTVGRFVLCNWPRSARFAIELWSSQATRFAGVRAAAASPKEALDAAERQLIEEHAPCFNEALNRSPAPVPAVYVTPAAQIRHLRSYRRMLQEARFMARRVMEPGAWDKTSS